MVSKKMKLIPHLINLLQRRNLELRQLAVMFLKKLSIFKENKDEMREGNISSELLQYVPAATDELTMAVLRLMVNLSFDTGIRTQLVKVMSHL